jgi:hypothetical protein
MPKTSPQEQISSVQPHLDKSVKFDYCLQRVHHIVMLFTNSLKTFNRQVEMVAVINRILLLCNDNV